MWKISLWVLMILAVSACAIQPQASAPTLMAVNQGYLTEAADIRATLSVQETEVLATSIAAETQVAQENGVNAMLLATVRAGDPPTLQVVAQFDRSVGREGGTPDPSQFSNEAAGRVVETYVSEGIRDSDGCGANPTNTFPEGTTRLFAVQRVQDIPANTLIGIEWIYGGQVAFADQLVVNNYEPDICLWFYLEPYSTGRWAVQFLSNGVPVGERVEFTVGAS